MGGAVWQFILIGLMSLWFFGWVGTVFLSSTRVVFATAFDRVLPEGAAKVEQERRSLRRAGADADPVDTDRLALRVQQRLLQLDAGGDDGDRDHLRRIGDRGGDIAVAQAGDLQRLADRQVQDRGSAADHGDGVGFLALLVFCLVKWLFDDVYALNDTGSLIYMGSLYVVAFAIYAVSRLWRKRQGIDMTMVHKEIPVE